MGQIQFIQTTPNELIHELKLAIIPELKEQLSKEFQPKEPEEFLTRNEARELLKINLSTLTRWTQKGDLISYVINQRVYYKRSEIVLTLERNKIRHSH